MIVLYEEYKLLILCLCLAICVFCTIFTYIKYRSNKYNTILYTYGFLLQAIAAVILIIKYYIGNTLLAFPIIAAPIGILGLSLMIIGAIKDKKRK